MTNPGLKNEKDTTLLAKIIIDPSELTEIREASLHLRALNNTLRRKIMDVIWENNNCIAVSELYRKMNLVQSVASTQLAILRKSSFVNIRREGKFIYYSVNRERINRVLELSKELGALD